MVSISKGILIAIGVVGFVSLAAIAGNTVQLLKYTGLTKRPKIKLYEINKNIKRLLDRGLIVVKEKINSKVLEITPKGRRLLLKYELDGLSHEKPKKWDGKYRVVIFDILEEKKNIRDQLRRTLHSFGFIYLQGSVWVYPYHCHEIIELLKRYLNLDREVLYMNVESIENDTWLKDRFGL